MPKYDFRCEACGWQEERQTTAATVPCGCGGRMVKLPHYHTIKFTVPLSFHTDIRDVLGDPDTVKAQARKGEIVPVGPGSRWI